MPHHPTLLIVDDNEAFLASLRRALRRDYEVRTASSQVSAMRMLSPPPDAVLLDLRLNEDDTANREGVELLQALQERFPQLPVLMITAHGDIDTAIECMRLGAADFIQKARANIQEVKARLAQALEHARLSRRVTELERDIQLVEPRTMIGQSEALREVKRYVEAVAQDANVTVLIRGETGTGKELVDAGHSR